MLISGRVRRHVSLLAGPLLLLGLAFLPSAAAAQVAQVSQVPVGAGSASSSATTGGQPKSTAAQPHLTTNTPAPCNSKPKKGHAQCYAVVRTPANHEITPTAAGPPSTALGPADIQDAYNLPVDHGAGQMVAIVDAGDDPKAEADLAVFREQYGLPPCTTDNGCFTKPRSVERVAG